MGATQKISSSFSSCEYPSSGWRVHKRFAVLGKSVFVHRARGVVITVSPSALPIVLPRAGVSSFQDIAQPPFRELPGWITSVFGVDATQNVDPNAQKVQVIDAAAAQTYYAPHTDAWPVSK